MNRSKAILVSLRLANSFLSTRVCSTSRPLRSQVTMFSHSSLSSLSNQSYSSHLIPTHQKLYFSSTPNSVVELVLANEWSIELEKELDDSHPAWNHETVIFVLKKLDKDPEKASDFFNWVCEKDGFRHSSSLYSIMLRILADKETMKQFWVTLRKMKQEGFYLDEETYFTISGKFKKEKMASDVAALSHFYNRMIQENAMDKVVGSVVDVILGSVWNDNVEKQLGELNVVFSDNVVIRVLKELRSYPSKAASFFRCVGKYPGYEHNTVTYNAIARVLCQHDSIEEFWSVIEEMKGADHDMDIDTYIKISRQFQKNKMMEDAVKLYELMMDGPFKPSVQDCSMLLRSISANDNPNLDLVFRVAKKYESTGHTLSKAIYDGIHRSLTSAGRFNEAEKIVNVMQNAGYEPDNITYSQVVFGLCKARRLEEACEVLDEMEALGCVPDIKTWTILIQGHCAAGEVDKALMCFASMMGKNYDADADLVDVLINGFISQRKIEGAYNLLIEMVNRTRLRPWQATYKNLIEKLLGVMKLEEALELLRMMKKQNYPPYPDPFVQYISKFGTVEDAAGFLKALTVKEYPSSSAYVHLLKSFFHEGRYSEAKDLLFKCPHHIRKHAEVCKLFGSTDSTASAA
ncbi:pentatricopeptide repeat-containing protein At3g48250, chloroplastic [Ziziphus jujuba]|uniref:Pentatricopeptide repeat-containing protein At3g48250, chloroplastic n=1 Tax=Ziziphus jujuba TaxID=326968 RepID=A0A6P3Z012_ZIZJJ|nr:pentatricopeptide repeat-containing protein At3g48250, chloroplastic [Ziziphus jujuba]